MSTSQWSSLFGESEAVVNSELSSSNGASLSNPTKTPESGAHLKYCLFPHVPSHVPKPGFCLKIEKNKENNNYYQYVFFMVLYFLEVMT